MTKHKKGKNSLNSALNRALTSGLRSSLARSGVSSMLPVLDDLVLWLETTSTDSFDEDERVDGATITTWYDTNPLTSTEKHNATNTGTPTYDDNSMNGLPSINVSNTGSYLRISGGTFFAESDYTFIFVEQRGASTGKALNGTYGNPNARIVMDYQDTLVSIGQSAGGLSATIPSFSSPTPAITIITQNSINGKVLYRNGQQVDTHSNTDPLSQPGSTILVGQFTGHLGEIIIYERTLSLNEINQIEAYLSAKWGIALD